MAAIMFTDMVGYTALGQKSEFLSLALVEEQRKLVRPVISRHSGREVKTMGDAFLVEFLSALDAIRCAYDIQRAIREFNFSLPEERRVNLRIGIHLGDVVESGGDISGDAVNVASRIEPFAEDGGVCLTRQVYDHVQNKFELPLTSLGFKPLKNVSASIEVYKMEMPWGAGKTVSSVPFDKRRIAVLPFANISPDPADEYFADGMTEELISTMSRISGLKVIARTSVMSYKGGQKKIDEVAKELQTGTILEGSVRKAGSKVRITVQLIDAQSSDHLWAESYDRELKDVFAVQSDISKTVAEALKVQLLSRERAIIEKKRTVNPEAYVLYLKGRFYWNERTEEGMTNAITYFEKAIEKDPDYAPAYSGMADCYRILANYGFVEPKASGEKAKELANRALELDETLAEAHASLAGNLYDADWEWSRAEAELRRAIELNPNYATAHHWLSINLGTQGRHEEAIAEIRKALELDPLSKVIQVTVAAAYWYARRYDEAIQELRDAIQRDPDFYNFHDYLGMVYATSGKPEEGVAELERATTLGGNMLALKADLGYAHARAGKKIEAQAILDELIETSKQKYVNPLFVAEVYVGLGQKENSLNWIEKAFRERSPDFKNQVTSPIYDDFRSIPRFVTILEKMGVTRT